MTTLAESGICQLKKISLIMKGKLILLFSLILSGVIYSCSGKEDPTTTSTPVTAITLNPTSISLKMGESATISATVSPSSATNKKIIWSSSNASVATVDEGKVTAKAAGSADIIALSDDSGIKATCTVTVTSDALPYEITYTDPASDDNTSHQYLLDYDANGIIKTISHIWGSTIDKYTYVVSGSTIVVTYLHGSDTYTYLKTLSDGYVKNYSHYNTGTWNYTYEYKYNGGYLAEATTTPKGSDVMSKEKFTWSNNNLTTITKDYDDGEDAYSYRIELTYGSDSNPYFGKNFDPMAILLDSFIGISGNDSFRDMMVGLLGHNGKILPKSAKWIGESGTFTYSFTYKFSDGVLTYVKITPSDPDEYVYEYNIKNKSFK